MKKVFKKLGIVAMTLSMFAFSSCEELKELAKVNFTYNDERGDITIPAITVEQAEGGEFILFEETYDLDLQDWLNSDDEASEFGIGDIREIKVSSLKILLPDGDGESNFGNIESLRVTVAAGGAEKEIAKVEDIPDEDVYELDVPITGSGDVKQLLVDGDGSITYTIYV